MLFCYHVEMELIIYCGILLMAVVSVSAQQCTIDEFQTNLTDILASEEMTNASQVITINSIFYNCLSSTQITDVYSSMSVSILYIRSDDSNNTHEVRYNLQCNNNVWEIVGNQSTALRNNNTRYCEDCTDQTVNEYHCTVG